MRAFVLLVAVLVFQITFAQNDARFENFDGVRYSSSTGPSFEAEGYRIDVSMREQGMDARGKKKIIRRLAGQEGTLEKDLELNVDVLTRANVYNGITKYTAYYLIPVSSFRTTIISFTRSIPRDVAFERWFVKAYLERRIPEGIIRHGMSANQFDFAGRRLTTRGCYFSSPHGVTCSGRGKITWSLFDSQEQADAYRLMLIADDKGNKPTGIVEEKPVTVKLEGTGAVATRTKITFELPAASIERTYTLISYYVTAYVRGKYVTCLMTQSEADSPEGMLAPLLAEVMQLQAADGSWIEQPHTIHEEPLTEESPKRRYDDLGTIKIESGVWMPVGNFAKHVGASPSVTLSGAIVNNPAFTFRADVVFTAIFLQKQQPFTYHLPDTSFNTRLDGFVGGGSLVLTKVKRLRRNKVFDFIDQMYGAGFIAFPTITNMPKADPGDKDSSYDIVSAHFSYGVALRRTIFKDRSIGVSLRYNLTPTGWYKDRVEKFGSSSFTTGLMIKL